MFNQPAARPQQAAPQAEQPFIGNEMELGAEILSRGVGTFSPHLVVEAIIKAVSARDEMLLQGDLQVFLVQFIIITTICSIFYLLVVLLILLIELLDVVKHKMNKINKFPMKKKTMKQWRLLILIFKPF